jgi:predicted helicase
MQRAILVKCNFGIIICRSEHSTSCKNQTLEQENHNLKVMIQNAVSQLREKTTAQYQLVDLLQSAIATTANDSDKENNSQRTKVDSLGREAYTNVIRAQLSYKKNKVQLYKRLVKQVTRRHYKGMLKGKDSMAPYPL